MKKPLISLFAVATLASCMKQPEPPKISASDYGKYPSNYKSLIKQRFDTILKDPESAKITYTGMGYKNKPSKTLQQIYGEGWQYGWAVCGHVNSKNSYGGYTGNKLFYALIRRSSLVKLITAEDYNGYGGKIAGWACGDIREWADDDNPPKS